MERYNRHIIIKKFGDEGQRKLANGRVLVIGAGGLGCPVLQYLTAAGVGMIGVVDADVVSLSNLQRQILYSESEIGFSKAQLASAKMHQLNSEVQLECYPCFLNDELADQLFPLYDLVIGATDNYNSRYLIDSKCIEYNIPFVHGSICEFEGQMAVFNFHGSISYADLFGEQPAEPTAPVGVLGALPGVIGSMMALEAIKIITQVGEVHSDKLLLYDALTNSFRQMNF